MAGPAEAPVTLLQAVDQLEGEAKELEQKLSDLRAYVRVSRQYGMNCMNTILRDIHKCAYELECKQIASKELRGKAAAEESVRRQVQELHAAKQPLQTFPLAVLDLDAKRADAPVWPQKDADDDFDEDFQFEWDLKVASGESPPEEAAGPSTTRQQPLAGACVEHPRGIDSGRCRLAQRLKEAILEESDPE